MKKKFTIHGRTCEKALSCELDLGCFLKGRSGIIADKFDKLLADDRLDSVLFFDLSLF